MPAGPLTLLLDTNVWVDYYLGFRPGHKDACRLLDAACALDAVLLYAVTTSKDLFYLIASDYKREFRRTHDGTLTAEGAAAADEVAWACLENMGEWATAVGCDQSDVWLARKQRGVHGDYEDNLVLAAAQRAKATLVVTNDERLLRHSPVAALDVCDAIAFLESKR